MSRRRASDSCEAHDLTADSPTSRTTAAAAPDPPEVVDLTLDDTVAPASQLAQRTKKRRPHASNAAAAAASARAASGNAAAGSGAGPSASGACGSASAALAAPAPGKKRRAAEGAAEGTPRKAKQKKPEKEKRQNAAGRTIPWAARPSIKVQERIQRALPGSGHRLFLVDREIVAPVGSEGGPVEEFDVLGATGNLYKVQIGKHPSCSCPDAGKGNLCKHHLFVMLRVIRLAQDDPLVWQRALLKGEAEEVLSGNRSTRAVDMSVHASDAVRRAHSQATGSGDAAAAAPAPGAHRPVEGDCPICFDDLQECGTATQQAIATCRTCGNHIHKECFDKWRTGRARQHLDVTCVYCRSPWEDPHAAAAAAGSSGKYVNLAHVSEAHRGADTSLDALYGATAVWINHHAHGGNRRHAAQLWRQLNG